MDKSARKKRGGGKLSRTETVTVRLDPKLRYLAGLAARRQRRTLSSFIEWAIEDSLEKVNIFDDRRGTRKSVADEAFTLWNIEEADRFVKLAFEYPDLLTYEEQFLWKLIKENGPMWEGTFNDEGENYRWQTTPETISLVRLHRYWKDFKAVAKGEKNEECLPPCPCDINDLTYLDMKDEFD